MLVISVALPEILWHCIPACGSEWQAPVSHCERATWPQSDPYFPVETQEKCALNSSRPALSSWDRTTHSILFIVSRARSPPLQGAAGDPPVSQDASTEGSSLSTPVLELLCHSCSLVSYKCAIVGFTPVSPASYWQTAYVCYHPAKQTFLSSEAPVSADQCRLATGTDSIRNGVRLNFLIFHFEIVGLTPSGFR